MDAVAPLPARIDGVWTRPLAEIETEGGPVLHMLRSDSPGFDSFGEIYFSLVFPGAVKAWKRHTLQAQNFAVPSGLIEVVIFDEREDSPSRGTLLRVRLGRPDHYQLLHMPPGLWYGFTCISEHTAVLANCADIPHAPEESVRIAKDSPRIPHSWED